MKLINQSIQFLVPYSSYFYEALNVSSYFEGLYKNKDHCDVYLCGDKVLISAYMVTRSSSRLDAYFSAILSPTPTVWTQFPVAIFMLRTRLNKTSVKSV